MRSRWSCSFTLEPHDDGGGRPRAQPLRVIPLEVSEREAFLEVSADSDAETVVAQACSASHGTVPA